MTDSGPHHESTCAKLLKPLVGSAELVERVTLKTKVDRAGERALLAMCEHDEGVTRRDKVLVNLEEELA